jgi:hypothetical protein
MRLLALPGFLLAILIAPSCHAAQGFSCDGGRVQIEIVGRDSPVWENRAEAVLTVSRDGVATILRYRNIDFIGGQCFAGNDGRALVLFQAFCAGSGCKDLANWGAIDPVTLRVLMVPTDANRDEVQQLIGGGLLPRLEMMSVLSEARRLGIEVPK